jgi:hypothetical protein
MVLKVVYPKGSYAGGLKGGTAFFVNFPKTESARLEYEILFQLQFCEGNFKLLNRRKCCTRCLANTLPSFE